MKIVVSTLNNSKNNYGALFQACGLYSFLTKLGHDVSFVTLEQRKQKNKSLIVIAKEWVKKILMLPHAAQFSTREKKFREFAKETQNQIIYKDREALFANPPQADIYISGSDQVWNPLSMHEDLFLAYVPKGGRKISYAASMGNEKIPAHNKEQFAKYISDFASISVREDTVINIVKSFTDKPVYQHVDPVFLKSHSDWEKLEVPYKKLRFKRYILTYIIEWNNNFNKKLKELKKETGLPIVSINLGNMKKVCADQTIYDASPCEFLYLLHNCECMVSTSFHGVAMSLVYNKPFLPLIGSDKPTRIQSLMRHFGIDETKSLNYGADEFEKINKIILQDQKVAAKYIDKAIFG
jgi:hypothetical protein